MATSTVSREVNGATRRPFAAVPVSVAPADKSYDRMTKPQQRWADVVKVRTEDPSWRCCGEDWDTIKRELQYLCGITWIPARESGGRFNSSGIETLKSAGLLVMNHFWMYNPQRHQQGLDPEVGISVKLYKVTFDNDAGEIVYGFNGQQDDLTTSSCYAKNLALMPMADAHGGVIDPVKNPELFETVLALEEYTTLAATEAGRHLIENPTFPCCLAAFTPDSIPDFNKDVDVVALVREAMNYVRVEKDGVPCSGDWLDALRLDQTVTVKSITSNGEKHVIVTDTGEIILLPRQVVLRPVVSENVTLDAGTVLGDFHYPHDVAVGENEEEAFYDALGVFAAEWLLRAVYEQSIIRHPDDASGLVCIPHVLVPSVASHAPLKFLDMRGDVGRQFITEGTLMSGDAPTGDSKLASLRVFHMRQPVRAEALQFSGPGFRADLFSVRPYWERLFRQGRAVINNGGRYIRKSVA